jgi:NADH:ubiquinone oxidoreductase subunit 2 (subunit N)
VLASALESSLWWVFFAMALMALVGAIFVTRFPKVVVSADDTAQEPTTEAAVGL